MPVPATAPVTTPPAAGYSSLQWMEPNSDPAVPRTPGGGADVGRLLPVQGPIGFVAEEPALGRRKS